MRGWFSGLDDIARLIVGLLVLAAALCAMLAVLSMCHSRDLAREARGDAAQAQGRTTSAVEAITEISRLNERGDASDMEVKDAQDAIRQADPVDRDRVARARLCRLQHRSDCDGV